MITDIKKFKRNFLQGSVDFSIQRTRDDDDVIKSVFRLIESGDYEAAAKEAGKSNVALKIFESALDKTDAVGCC